MSGAGFDRDISGGEAMARTLAGLGVALVLMALAAGAEAANQKTFRYLSGQRCGRSHQGLHPASRRQIKQRDRVWAFNNRGVAYVHKGDYERAIDD